VAHRAPTGTRTRAFVCFGVRGGAFGGLARILLEGSGARY